MVQVVLNDEQAKAVREAADAVELRDQLGRVVGYVAPPSSSAAIAEARSRLDSNGPWYTTEQVLERLHSLGQE